MRHLTNLYPNQEVPAVKGGRLPYVDFLQTVRVYTTNQGDFEERTQLYRFILENTAGTKDFVEQYAMKGWPIIGYGNLGSVDRDVAAEHGKIKAYCDKEMNIREQNQAYLEQERARMRLEFERGIEGKERGKKDKDGKDGQSQTSL